MNMVEWENIENCIISLKTGLNPRQNFKLNLPENTLPYITGKDIYNNKINISSNTDKIDSKAVSLINKRACLESGLLLFASTGTGTVGRMAIIEDYNNDWAISETLYAIKTSEELSSKYLMHVLYSDIAKKQFEPKISKGSVPHLKIADLMKVSIPVPSILEQNRIVGILDTFTASIENLKEQIAQRRKQYEYYRDQLLDLEGKPGVEMKMLKEVFDTRNGYTPSTSTDSFWENGTIPWFKMEDIRDNGRILYDSYLHITPMAVKGKGLFKANSIILATSATIGEHALILVDYLCNQRFTNFFPKEKYTQSIEMKYVYYYMFIIDEWCKQHVNQGGFASVDMAGLYNMSFPIPSLQEQQRIVSILDTFEASIQNLEAQLKQREKQYEYYRNKLLTFE